MRLLSRLFIILLICFVAITMPSSPAQTQDDDEPYISLSPSRGMPGTQVTVIGRNFTAGDKWVDIYYFLSDDWTWVADDRTDEDGDFRVTFIVPESCTGIHDVRAEDRWVYAYDEFRVEPGLTIEPEEGAVGTNVSVEGHGFADDEDGIELLYDLDGTEETVADRIEADQYGYWETTFNVPSSTRGDHDIGARGADTDLTDVEDATFEVMPEINIIDRASGNVIEEPSGSAGESIPITGTGFDGEDSYIKVLFGGEETETEPVIIRADENGDWVGADEKGDRVEEISFRVPDMPAGEYIVTAEGQSTREKDVNELTFRIAPGLILSPEEGHVGMNLTVTGGGFAPDKSVVMKYDAVDLEPPATTRTDEDGSFEVSFLVPKSKHGAHNITAEVAGETEAFDIFTMESDAPEKPELISPPDADRVGFIGKVRLTFNWSEAEDLSGVYYSLQIATSDNITDGGFADPVRSISNIVGTNYTLKDAEALPQGTYYWIVQAVDGAENTGNWTEPYSFRVGVMPLWAFVVIIVVVAGGIGAAVYFLVIRKRVYYY